MLSLRLHRSFIIPNSVLSEFQIHELQENIFTINLTANKTERHINFGIISKSFAGQQYAEMKLYYLKIEEAIEYILAFLLETNKNKQFELWVEGPSEFHQTMKPGAYESVETV